MSSSVSTLTKGKVAVYVILTKLRSCRWTRARVQLGLFLTVRCLTSRVARQVGGGECLPVHVPLTFTCTSLIKRMFVLFFIAHHQSFNVGRLRLKKNTLASPCPRVKSATEFIAFFSASPCSFTSPQKAFLHTCCPARLQSGLKWLHWACWRSCHTDTAGQDGEVYSLLDGASLCLSPHEAASRCFPPHSLFSHSLMLLVYCLIRGFSPSPHCKTCIASWQLYIFI